jgi:hypothetical protein
MSRTLIVLAALVSLATAALHVFGGGPEFLQPALDSGLPAVWKAGFSSIWHQITAFLVLNGIFLIAASIRPGMTAGVLPLVAVQNLAFAGLFLGYGLAQLGTPLALPQWIIFLAIAALLLVAIGLRTGQEARPYPTAQAVL